MAQEWGDSADGTPGLLQEGSFGGVKFDFVSVRDSGSNDIDEQKMKGRQGSKIDPRGRNSGRWDILAVIIEDDYPQKMFDLVNKLDDGGVVKEFVHPIFGSRQASCPSFTVNHDAEDARDSCTISISLVESVDEEFDLVARTNTTPARANAVRSLLDQVLVALSAFEAALEVQNQPAVLEVMGAVNAMQGVADSLEATGDELTNLAISSTTNGALDKVNVAAVTLADYESTEQYDLVAALLEAGNALRDLAAGLLEQRPPLSTHDVVADTNHLQLAHDLEADAEELLTLNSFPDPSLIPAGFRLLRYAV